MDPVTYYTGLGARVTSPFGPRIHPITGKQSHHNGVDFGGKAKGFPWPNFSPGTVTHRGEHGARGKLVVVKCRDLFCGLQLKQIYQHLDGYIAKGGDVLAQGDPVGTNGRTGDCTGEHLHYELRVDDGSTLGAPVWGDPAKYHWREGMDKLIVIHTEADRGVGALLEYKLKAPVIARENATQELLDSAATIIQVGGPPLATKAKLLHLSGSTRVNTAWAVLEFIEREGRP